MIDRRCRAKSLLAKLDQLPPCLVRLAARKRWGHQALSHRDIADAASLSVAVVASLSLKTSWRGVKIETAEAFAKACGVELLRGHRTIRDLKRNKMAHLFNGNAAQVKFQQRLLALTPK